MKRLIVIIALAAAACALLVIPQVRLSLFGNTFERGNEETFLGLSLGLDLQGGTHLVYETRPEEGREVTEEDLEGVRRIIESRVNQFGLSEPTVQLLGTPPDRVMIQLPGLSGSSITVSFAGAGVTPEEFQAFFREEIGREDAEVRQADDGSLIVQMNDIQDEVRNQAGEVTTPSEADQYREQVEARFAATMTLAFTPVAVISTEATVPDGESGEDASSTPPPDDEAGEQEEEATATPQPEHEFVTPTIDEVIAAFEAAGRPDAEVTEAGNGIFTATLYGIAESDVDDEGNPIPGDVDKITDAMRAIGSLAANSPFLTGNISQWTVGGGVLEAKQLIGSIAQLEFRERICGGNEDEPQDGLPSEVWIVERCTNARYYQEQATNLLADDLVDAFAGVEPSFGPVVNVVFNDKGADEFYVLTDRISRTKGRLAVYLDGEELVAPATSAGIQGGRAFIYGNFTPERARTVSIQLRSGALPVSLELIQERTVDATLGEDSLQRSLIAGGIGLILLLVFMVAYYKVPGLVAAIALVIYTALLLAIFKGIPVVLTLSGAAAIVLSLGFAVDANILIAERTKEELRTGRSLIAAITEGFDRAWPSIRDGNISTIITAVVLFWFGDRFSTSMMQGFALTLGIGVALSMFTAFFASRVILRLVAGTPVGRWLNLFVPVRDASTGERVGQAR